MARGGNLNPTGRNHFSARRPGTLFNISIDFSEAHRLLSGIGEETRRADPAILATHKDLAEDLQFKQAEALRAAVRARGRLQRQADIMKGPLYQAIRDEKNRKVNIHGYTVGYLSDKGKFPHVALYADGLEDGTPIHRVRMLGYWITPDGTQVGPVKGALDAVGFHGRVGDPRGFMIENAIKGYHYQQIGFQKFEDAGMTGEVGIEIYEGYFKGYGLNFLATMLARTRGAAEPRHISVSSTVPGT